jgi:stalled ribosome alternative rescue factor ArfA
VFLPTLPGTLEARDLAAFRNSLMAKSGMFLAQPDIIDFTRAEISDVTTQSQFASHVVRVWADTGEATQIAATAPPAGSGTYRLWKPGTWTPAPWYRIAGDLYISVTADQGILVYQAYKDASKELLEALILAAIIAAMKNSLKGKANPVLAKAYAAAFIAVAVITHADVAFASEGTDPIESMFNALKLSGIEVPDELKTALLSDPEFKARLEKAAREKGTPSEKAKRLANEMMKTIAANRDQFSREDLEALVQLTEMQDLKDVPDAAPTAEALKSQLKRIRNGEIPDPGGRQSTTAQGAGGQGKGGPGGGGPSGAERGPAPVKPTTPTRPVTGVPGPTPADPKAQADLAARYPGLSPATIQRLAAAPAPARSLLADMLSSTRTQIVATDAFVNRYLEITKSLTEEQYGTLSAQLAEIDPGTTIDQVLDSIEKGLAAPTKEGSASGAPSTEPKAPETEHVDPEAVRTELVKLLLAREADLGRLPNGALRLYWKQPIKKMDEQDVVMAGKTPKGVIYLGLVRVRFGEVSATHVAVKVLFAYDFIDRTGGVVYQGSAAIGRDYSFDVVPSPVPPLR